MEFTCFHTFWQRPGLNCLYSVIANSKHFWDELKWAICRFVTGSVVIVHQSNQTQWEIYSNGSAACKLIFYFLSSYFRLMLKCQQMKLGMLYLHFTTYCMSWNNSCRLEYLWASVRDRKHIRLSTKQVYVLFSWKNDIHFFSPIDSIGLILWHVHVQKTTNCIYMAD